MEQHQIGLIGLAVMGQNLALNIAEKGYSIAVYNRTEAKTKAFLTENTKAMPNLHGYYDLATFVSTLERPRKIILMVKAGEGTEELLNALSSILEPGDILVDGGNAYFEDTQKRSEKLLKKGLEYVGLGVSGGETGARHGPSLMFGGSKKAWEALQPILEAISAKASPEQFPCALYLGHGGAGHYVKMVHNGIEYADMQMIAEIYGLMRNIFALTPAEAAEVFARWNRGPLGSYLIEITAKILLEKDPKTDQALVECILDVAEQKGTGRWVVQSSLELGVPVPSIAGAIHARSLSAFLHLRKQLSAVAAQNLVPAEWNSSWEEKLHSALLCAKWVAYSQGFLLLKEAGKRYNWDYSFSAIARVWQAGCIIRAELLESIAALYDNHPTLEHFFLDLNLQAILKKHQAAWREVVSMGAQCAQGLFALSSALHYYDLLHSGYCVQNLVQAQRDYFGAHTFERIDTERGKTFHHAWD